MKQTRKYREWTDNQLIEAVKNSISIAQVLRKLNLREAGGNYHNIKRNIDRLKLNVTHFKAQGWNRNTYHNIGDLVNPTAIKRNLIHQRGLKCENCTLSKWLDKPIKLELHHIDGNRSNNLETNLLLVCPNCHAYTDNYRGKKNKCG